MSVSFSDRLLRRGRSHSFVHENAFPGYVSKKHAGRWRSGGRARMNNDLNGEQTTRKCPGLPDGLSLRDPRVLVATCCGVGLLPKAPGTWGSLVALPLAWVLHQAWGRPGLAAATLLVFLAGIWSAEYIVRRSALSDPGFIVIDEIAGQWIVLLAAHPDVVLYVAGFALFRVADILKPWPASWADRKIGGGFGVMLDDILAALYAAAVLYGLRRLLEGAT